MAKHGKIFWNELNTKDADGSKAFYGEMFGWDLQDGPMPNGEGRYIVAKQGDDMIAGIFPLEGPEFEQVPSSWLTYVAVDDIEHAASELRRLGGMIMREPFEVPSIGKFAIARDPQGAVFALAQPSDEG
ncbi:MAG: VOC family protein [Geminicoccaceae bacterium]